MSDVYPGPSPAAVTATAANGEQWSFDIFDYILPIDGSRTFQLAVFIRPVGANAWQLGHGCFNLPMSNAQNFQIPGQAPEWVSFLDVFNKYGAGVVDKFIPSVQAWMTTRYGSSTPTTPADQEATAARQAIATRIFTFKPTADGNNLEPK